MATSAEVASERRSALRGWASLAAVTLAIAVLVAAAAEALGLQLVGRAVAHGAFERLLLVPALAGPVALGALALLALEFCVLVALARLGLLAAGPASGNQQRPTRIGPTDATALLAGLVVFTALSWLKEYLFELHYIAHAYDRVAAVAAIFATLNVALTMALLGLSLGVGLLARRALSRLAMRWPEAPYATWRAARFVALSGALAAGMLWAARQSAFLPVWVPGATLALALMGLQLLAALVARVRVAAARQATLVAAVAVLLGLAVLGPRLAAAPLFRLRQTLVERSPLAGSWLSALSWGADLDGDGRPSLFGGGDCDDADPGVHPLAIDLPGDGIDQNCTGADAAALPGAGVHPLLPWAAGSTRRRLLWIVVDSLRFDRTGAAGSERRLTPNIDAFAGVSATFTQARSQAVHTEGSFPSFLTSKYPSYLQHFDRLSAGTSSERVAPVATLAEVLAQRGYETALITPVTNLPARATEGFRLVERSLADRRDAVYGVTSRPVTLTTGRQLRQWQSKPFFVLAHYFDPHGAYVAHKVRYFGDSDLDRYDSEVAYTDMHMGALLQLLKDDGFLRDTVVVISGDHGEAFGEHGYVAHGTSLYEEMVRVPLILFVPGLAPRVLPQPVGLIDVMPTVLAALGVPDPGGLQGRSLLPLITGQAPPPTWPLLLDSNWDGMHHLRGVVAEGHKYVLSIDDNVEALFDLASDPGETLNLAGERPALRARYRTLLGDLRDTYLHAALFPTHVSSPRSTGVVGTTP